MKAKEKRTRKASRKLQPPVEVEKVAHPLPPDWPKYTTEEYYSWMMDRMPTGAITANWSKHNPHNSYSPIFWYEDQPQKCVDCGCDFVFSKEEQQHWYEILKIPIYAQATRCPKCRAARRREKIAQKLHMEKVAQTPPHPHQAFFRRKT